MQMFNMQSDHIAQYLKQSVVWPSTGCCGWEKFYTPPLNAWGARKDSVLCGESHVAFNVRNTITRHKAGLSLKQGWYMDRCHLDVRNSEIASVFLLFICQTGINFEPGNISVQFKFNCQCNAMPSSLNTCWGEQGGLPKGVSNLSPLDWHCCAPCTVYCQYYWACMASICIFGSDIYTWLSYTHVCGR